MDPSDQVPMRAVPPVDFPPTAAPRSVVPGPPLHPTARIHATAIIHPSADIGPGVEIGPYAVIGAAVVLGEGCRVGPHCVLEHVRMGRGNVLTAHVHAGLPPQDLHATGDGTHLRVGDGNVFREGVTLHRGARGDTVVGSNGFFMAYAHVGHDCRVGNHVTLANGACLGGYVEVGDRANLSAMVAVHQFCRIGSLAMVSGLSGVVMDIPPFCTASGGRARLVGLNRVGLERAGISKSGQRWLAAAYRTLFRLGLPMKAALLRLEADVIDAKEDYEEVAELVRFCRASRRGIARPRKGRSTDDG